MAKPTPVASRNFPGVDGSAFTLTFAIEIVGIEVWHDCNEGWLDLGACTQGMKIQYQLYPGQIYELDILIWPHAVKIWSGMNSGWVRTWQFLDRRWLTFDIRHIFPVKVVDLKAFVATVSPTFGVGALGSNAKNDKVTEVFLPRLEFGQQRYFAPVIEEESSFENFIYDLIWKIVEYFIPASYLDGLFDVPHPVADARHQDAVLRQVKETTLNRNLSEQSEPELSSSSKKTLANQKKKAEAPKTKFELNLSGNNILSGTGQQVAFQAVGDRPPELGEFFAFISSQNLPASDDYPILFVNIDSLFDVPTEALSKYQISHIYTRWSIGEETHDSEQQLIGHKTTYRLNDHYALPLPCDMAFKIICELMDDDFCIQLRGIRVAPKQYDDPTFFGYDKKDRLFATNVPPSFKHHETDLIIAKTKINARSLGKGVSGVVQGEFALLPPNFAVKSLGRQALCSNDQNGINLPVYPEQIVPSYVILDAQMTLEVRMGYSGCRPQKLEKSYSRMICLISDQWLIMELLMLVADINRELDNNKESDEYLSGFAIDTGDTVIFYVEGPKDGVILQLWERTGDYYPHTNPLFSSSAKYASRVYPDLMFAGTTLCFKIMKMFVPLSAVLACPPVYARPVLPILARNTALKLGRLLSNKRWWRLGPPTSELPTSAELVSFRQELCAAPRPTPAMTALCSMLPKYRPNKNKHGFN
ncbi:uncharacterized protein LOC125229408 [Leguminivora glycinivorella]|uniref:uncharacterized protein LOC125229408 n=1 Tax=Leguminivora glycinivorella TaxID=1035111 RepID=UPI00200E6274|nr:uncharacterized protein LOC125229408 [Leguminivora glycinivorella]